MGEFYGYNSIMELENDKSKWNLASDLKLLVLLKSSTDEIINNIEHKSSSFEEFIYKTNVCSDKIQNLITNILILTNSKFIENRVYEEDIKEITSTNNSIPKQNNQIDDEQIIVKKLINSIDIAISSISSKYKLSSEDINSYEKYTILNRLYSIENEFTKKPLPYLLGSDEFLKDTFIGLKAEKDNPVIVLNPSHHESEDVIFDQSNSDNDSENSIFNAKLPKSNVLLSENEEPIDDNTYITSEKFKSHNQTIFDNENDEDDIFYGTQIIKNETKNLYKNNFKDSLPHSSLFDNSLSENENEDLYKTSETETNAPLNLESDDKVPTHTIPVSHETNVTSRSTVKPIKETLDSIFSSDSEDDVDIFNVKTSKSQILSKQIHNFTDFSSDEDDLFNQINNKSNESTNTKTKIETQNIEATNENKKTSVKLKDTSTVGNDIGGSIMSNMLKELTASIKNKSQHLVENDSSNDENIHDSNIKHAKAEKEIIKEFDENQTETFSSTSNLIPDDFNSLLKHKAKLNASRNRKLPSRHKLFQPVEETPQENVEATTDKELDITENDTANSTENTATKHTDFFLNFSDDSENEFPVANLSKASIKNNNEKNNSSSLFEQNSSVTAETIGPTLEFTAKKIQASIFDSDDSDDDIFTNNLKSNLIKQPMETQISKPIQPNSNKVSIFSDSDDDDVDFLAPTQKVTSTTLNRNQVNNRPSKENLKAQVKSIFDSDSSDDDLFKS